MIQIKPMIGTRAECPYCGGELVPGKVLWQGIHVCAVSACPGCHAEIVADMEVGHALFAPCRVDVKEGRLFLDDAGSASWFGEPLLRSLRNPVDAPPVSLKVERFSTSKRVIILNCIDFLYGHSLLKLLNAEAHLAHNPELGLVVLAPAFLHWMVPQGVAEIWIVDLPLARAQNFHPELDRLIQKECERFDEIYLSPAHSHPKEFDITRFTGIERHAFEGDDFRITFIWREDRLWSEKRWMVRIARRVGGMKLLLLRQNFKVRRLFFLLRLRFPHARFTVIGLGTATRFPAWVDDRRVDRFDSEREQEVCRLYAESRLVLGVHGSNLLLPSAHAGMTMDLMPLSKWSNFAEDILYQEDDCRMAAYRYRYLPLDMRVDRVANVAASQLNDFQWYRKAMVENLRDIN